MAWIHRIHYLSLHLYRRIFKVKTRNARVILRDKNTIALVKFMYGDTWELPGGYVDRRESFEEAARREIREELALEITSFVRVLGEYTDTRRGRNKTLQIFVTKEWEQVPDQEPSRENSDIKWVPLNDLPENIDPATRRRIEEYLSRREEMFFEEW